MKEMNNRIALITGVTSGIGRASARRMAEEGFRLILAGRRKERLTELAEELKSTSGTECYLLEMDVRDRGSVKMSLSLLPEHWKSIDVLINNAGLAAGLDPVHEADFNDWDQMMDTNVKGLLNLTRLVTPGMVERGSGHIINISSIAGKEVYPNASVYCASKHAVEALTKGIRQDLLPFGIKVSSIAPGAVETEFSLVRFKWDAERSKRVYEGFDPLMGEDIADAVVYILSRPSHVNIQDMLIMPSAQANATMIKRNPQ